MIISRPLSKVCFGAVCLALSVSALAQAPASDVSAEIRRTTFGVPHIRAADERGLGYGIGYAYAQDNLCLLANEVVTVNGERSKYFGPQALTLEQQDNLASDVFFNWLNTPEAVAAFWQAQTDTLLIGGTTYDAVLGFEQWPYAGKRVVVLSHRDFIPRHGELLRL